jgi:hypothetical protein
MQITLNPFLLTADQVVLVADFLAKAAGVITVSDRPDVGAPETPQLPLFTATPLPETPQLPLPEVVPPVPPTLPAPAATSPSPVPASSAPAAVALPVAAPAPDKRGLPWDERIHSANRTMNADGTWRRRSKIGDDLVAQVEAELLGLPPAPAVPSAAELVAKMSAEPALVPVAPVVMPVPPAAAGVTFQSLATRAGPAMAGGKIAQINAAIAVLGVNFLELGRPDNAGLLPAAEAMLAAEGLLS